MLLFDYRVDRHYNSLMVYKEFPGNGFGESGFAIDFGVGGSDITLGDPEDDYYTELASGADSARVLFENGWGEAPIISAEITPTGDRDYGAILPHLKNSPIVKVPLE